MLIGIKQILIKNSQIYKFFSILFRKFFRNSINLWKFTGAGNGNRTRVTALARLDFTIKLYLQIIKFSKITFALARQRSINWAIPAHILKINANNKYCLRQIIYYQIIASLSIHFKKILNKKFGEKSKILKRSIKNVTYIGKSNFYLLKM